MFKTEIKRDESDHVTKLVFTSDTAVAEAVLYRYPDYKTRTVICCSTQSGCPIGCTFCGAGTSFVRNLSSEEILFQIEEALKLTGTDPDQMDRLQILFMSMGEPLLNKNGVSETIRELYRRYPKAVLLLSTSAPRIDYSWVRNLSIEVPTVGLQFSIHESTDKARDILIPFKNKLFLTEIADEGIIWFLMTGRNPFINYCVHEGNSSYEDATRLAYLFDRNIFKATISVICEKNEYTPGIPGRRDLAESFSAMLSARGFDVRVFDPAGQDTIGGGCGQLWFVQDWMKTHKTMKEKSFEDQ